MGKDGNGMIRRKIAALVMAGILAFSVSGCADDVPEGNTLTEAELEEQEEIRSTAGNRLEAVRELGKISIGISPDYAPFAFEAEPKEEGELPYAGSDIALGNYIAEQMGVEAEFCEMEFEECLNAVEEGSVDIVLLGMLPKPERKARMDFTDVYYKPGKQVLLVKEAQKEKFTGLEAFEGKTVAAQYGTLQAQLVTEQLPGTYMELTDDISKAVLMLRMGTADGVALDETVAKEVLQEHTDLAISPAELSYTPEGVVGGAVKGETELLEQINEILSGVTKEGLYFKWLEEATIQARTSAEDVPTAGSLPKTE